jgi:hypothetical protein
LERIQNWVEQGYAKDCQIEMALKQRSWMVLTKLLQICEEFLIETKGKEVMCLRKKCHQKICKKCSKIDKEGKFKNCGQCNFVSYCSKNCQEEDWEIHKQTCKKNNVKF